MNRKTSTLLSLGISLALIAVGIWFLGHHQNSFGYADNRWFMPSHMVMGDGGMGIVMVLFWMAILSAIGLVISGIVSNHQSSDNNDDNPWSDPEQILKKRYARGEIDKSKFEEMKRDLL